MAVRAQKEIAWDGRAPRPFRICVEEQVLADLRARLSNVRWPDTISGDRWAYGADPDYMKSLTAYWRDGYDWRRHEASLNTFNNFKVTIGGIDLHFVHEQGEGPSPRPLLLTHGWPGSFYEYHKLIPRLAHPSRFGGDPRDAFTIVVPSMPGHGFSFSDGQRRFGISGIADILHVLMRDVLGYQRYGAHGHDWGAFVATRLGYAFPQYVDGIHITLLAIPRQPLRTPRNDDEVRYKRQIEHWLQEETGYSHIMGTKPQTLSFALTDSPVGLAAWIIEKFRSWSDCDGDLDAHFSRDVLLTNIMLYWVTGAIGSSFWPYYARLHEPWIVPAGGSVVVPTGYAEHPREILTPPRSLVEHFYTDIRRWTRMERGGHFASLENAESVADDIAAFFRSLM